MSVRVKICGITSLEDGLAAVDAGADALGFMFYEPSARNVSVEQAAAIIKGLPPFVNKVGVFVDPSDELVTAAVEQAGIETLQFHGDESLQFCEQFRPFATYKAFRVKDESSLEAIKRYPLDAALLDSYVAGQVGGTGEQFNWGLARHAKAFGQPIILAGGLTPQNVGEAVKAVEPFGVDVSSGVEVSKGVKDHDKIREFVRNAKSA